MSTHSVLSGVKQISRDKSIKRDNSSEACLPVDLNFLRRLIDRTMKERIRESHVWQVPGSLKGGLEVGGESHSHSENWTARHPENKTSAWKGDGKKTKITSSCSVYFNTTLVQFWWLKINICFLGNCECFGSVNANHNADELLSPERRKTKTKRVSTGREDAAWVATKVIPPCRTVRVLGRGARRQMQFVTVRPDMIYGTGASSQQMVGEIKSVTQTVTMELWNTGGAATPAHQHRCERICMKSECLRALFAPKKRSRTCSTRFHRLHGFLKQRPAVCNVRHDPAAPLSPTTGGGSR